MVSSRRTRSLRFAATLTTTLAVAPLPATADVIADFDGTAFPPGWTVTGDAFGNGPASGSLDRQMTVSGWTGPRFANSYHGTDRAQGTLTSPPFTIEKDYVCMLVGGGAHPGKTAVNLIIDSKVALTTTGTNDEHLTWDAWDVRSLKGKQARIQIVDRESGGWGHILVDQIMQTDQPPITPIATSPLYAETHRPQFHFTSAKNWINDPNGLVFYEGQYHLFFQHNPLGNEWGNMTWGHAVSPDLLHWTQRPDAITPDELGTIFSGSAVVDWKNTSGLGKDGQPPLIAMYTAAGGTNDASKGKKFTQCLAYSNDKGKTWIKYDKNPVLGHVAGENRDPKVIWHEPTGKWVMALYLEGDRFAIYNSPDLKQWTTLHEVRAPQTSGECPDFFPLAVDGDASNTKWVFTVADAKYLIGSFDGTTFKPETDVLQVDFGRGYQNYAVQTYSDIPDSDGRRIQIGWLRNGKFPRMPFNGQMSFPSELTLKSTAAGPRLFRTPIREVATLHDKVRTWTDLKLAPGENPLADLNGDLFHIRAEIEPGDARAVGFIIRGEPVRYTVAEKKLAALGELPADLKDGRLTLEILVDRTTIETFVNNGQAAASSTFLPSSDERPPLSLFSEDGTATVRSLTVATLKSTWPKQTK